MRMGLGGMEGPRILSSCRFREGWEVFLWDRESVIVAVCLWIEDRPKRQSQAVGCSLGRLDGHKNWIRLSIVRRPNHEVAASLAGGFFSRCYRSSVVCVLAVS